MTDSDYSRFLSEMVQRQREAEQHALTEFRNQALPALRDLEVDRVVAEYSGSGDTGGIDCLSCYQGQVRVPPGSIPSSVQQAIETYVYSLLPAGFEINDGGQGEVTIDVEAGTARVNHGSNYTETTVSEREYPI